MPKPELVITDVETDDAALSLLDILATGNTADDPRLFARTGGLARVIETDRGRAMQPLTDRLLVFESERAVSWRAWRGGPKNRQLVPCKADKDIVYHLGDMGYWPGLPELDTLLMAPTILPDGRILNGTGYDPPSLLYMAVDSKLNMPPLPDEPSEDDCHRASLGLQDYLSEFRFAGQEDRANAFGLLMAHVLKPLMGRGAHLPLFLVDAPTAGSGKGLLINVASNIAQGRDAISQFVERGRNADEEMRKRITSMLLRGQEFVHLDNLEVDLRSGALSALLTADIWTDRELGRNFQLELPITTTFAASGNNIQVTGDMGRRVVAIRIDTGFQMPFLRTFRRMDLLGDIRRGRGQILGWILTLARRWVQQGCPIPSPRTIMGSFQPVADVVGGVLHIAEISGWLGNLLRFTEAENAELTEWTRFVHAWYALWGETPQLAKAVAEALNSPDVGYQDLREAMPDQVRPYTEVERAKLSTKLGASLRERQDQVFDGLQLRRAGQDRSRAVLWQVRPAARAEDGPTVTPPETPRRARAMHLPFAEDAEVAEPQGDLTNTRDVKGPEYSRTRKGPQTPSATSASSAETTPAARPRAGRAHDAAAYAYAAVPLKAFKARLMKCILCSLDTETTGLYPWLGDRIRLLQIATTDEVQVIDTWKQPEALDMLRPVLEGKGPMLAMHNAKFDLAMLKVHGLGMPPRGKVFDTYLASMLLDNSAETRPKQSLKALAKRYLDRDLPKEMQKSDWSTPELTQEQVAYAAEDARTTYDLARLLEPLIDQHKMREAYEIELAVLPIIIDLHFQGVRIDPVLWAPLAEEAERQQIRAAADLVSLAGEHNWASPSQMLAILQARGIDIPSTEESYLQDHAQDPFVSALLRWREWNKGVTTYGLSVLKACDEQERFHAEYNQADTRTGRMTANIIQQVPRAGGYRQAIRPLDGRCLVKCDYKQLQLVIVAELADDRSMQQAFNDGGTDIHTQTAARVLGVPFDQVTREQRQQAKALNFGLVFGSGAEGLRKTAARDYGVDWTLEQATLLRDKFFFAYPGVRRWHREPQHQGDEPLDVRVASGRRRLAVKRFTQRVNSPVQMLEADGVKSGLVLLDQALKAAGLDAHITMIVHDEVDLDCRLDQAEQVAALARECLETGMNKWLKRTRASIDVDIYRDWAGTPLTIEGPVGA